MAELNCIVVTPEATAFETKAEFVAVPLFDGEIGILPGRSPLIGRLGFGELRIKSGGKSESYYIDGGFVQVADNIVSVLTNRAIEASDVDAAAAKDQLSAAMKQPANSQELLDIRDRAVAQARGQLRVSSRG